jgi:PAS domain S-box-containing protein
MNRNFKILVFEDNAGDLLLIDEYLEEKFDKPTIVHAKTFGAGSIVLIESPSEFDVILLDLSLPDKSGEFLVTEILKFSLTCPIIILTGYSDVSFSIKSIARGISDYLLKDDLNATTLYKSIIYCIERRKQLKELEDSEKRYSDLFHLSPQPMWLYDPEEGRFIQANKAASDLYGYTQAEFLEMPASHLRANKDDDSTLRASKAESFEQDSESFLIRTKQMKKSGAIIDVDIYSTPITINGRLFRSVIAIDVTEKVLFEINITRAIIKTQEDERYEIGAELHDNICQVLVSSLMAMGMMKNSINASGTEFYNKAKEYILLATSEIRNLSHRLAPAFFDNSTLEEAFETLLLSFTTENKIKLNSHFDEAVNHEVVDRELKINLYRILQEQLNNIFKYAKAKRIDVDVMIHNKKVKMKIADNGIGFDMAKVKKGIGLANMKRRTELFLGSLLINSSIGHGCEIVVEIPLPEVTPVIG